MKDYQSKNGDSANPNPNPKQNQIPEWWRIISRFRGPELGIVSLTLISTRDDSPQINQLIAVIGIIMLSMLSTISWFNEKLKRFKTRYT